MFLLGDQFQIAILPLKTSSGALFIDHHSFFYVSYIGKRLWPLVLTNAEFIFILSAAVASIKIDILQIRTRFRRQEYYYGPAVNFYLNVPAHYISMN